MLEPDGVASGHFLFYLLTRVGSGCADTATATLVAKCSKPKVPSS